MLKTNLHYFRTSVNTPEILEERYMVLKWDENLDKSYVPFTNCLKEHIATIKTLRAKGKDAEQIYKDLFALFQNEFTHKSEFVCFANACDSTVETLLRNYDAFKFVVDLFIDYRDCNAITPREWIQALIDRGASRSLGNVGEEKLAEIAEKHGHKRVSNWFEMERNTKSVTIFSNGIFDYGQIETRLGISLKRLSQNKLMDVIIRNGNRFIFLEAKHLKQTGGSQDKQLKELIEVIKQMPKTKGNIAMVGGFADGVYSNTVLNITETNISNPETISKRKRDTKLVTQQKEIIETLKTHPNSFWFNTAGFTKFVNDFAE